MAMIPPLSDLNDQPQYAGKGSQTPLQSPGSVNNYGYVQEATTTDMFQEASTITDMFQEASTITDMSRKHQQLQICPVTINNYGYVPGSINNYGYVQEASTVTDMPRKHQQLRICSMPGNHYADVKMQKKFVINKFFLKLTPFSWENRRIVAQIWIKQSLDLSFYLTLQQFVCLV